MSLLLLEGFDDGLRDQRWLASAYDGLLNPPTVLNARNGKSQVFERGGLLERSLGTDADDKVSVGFWGLLTTMPSVAGVLMSFRETSIVHVQLAITPTGQIQVSRAGVVLGTTPQVWVNSGLAHYVEISVRIHDTLGTVEILNDGVTIMSLSAIDTQNGGTPEVNAIRWEQSITGSQYHNIELSDIYITNEIGAAPYNGFLGDIVIDTLLPNGNGTYSQFVGSDADSIDNYLLVNEATPDGDTTYVQSGTDTNKDSYGFDDLIFASGAVRGVILAADVRNGGGPDNLQPITRIGAVDYNGATKPAPSGYNIANQVWQVSPASAGDWTIAEVNAAEFGIENVV